MMLTQALLLVLGAAAEPPSWWCAPSTEGAWVRERVTIYDGPQRHAPLGNTLPEPKLLALGEHSALIDAGWGIVRVERDEGIVELLSLPEGWDQVRLGNHDSLLVSSGGTLWAGDQPRWHGVVAWDATPGQLAVATEEKVIVSPGPDLQIRGVEQVLTNHDGRVVAATADTLHVLTDEGWRREPRPEGELERIGARITRPSGRIVRVLTVSGQSWLAQRGDVPDDKAWLDQVVLAESPCGVDENAEFRSDAEPAAPPDPPPPEPQPDGQGLLLQLIPIYGESASGTYTVDLFGTGTRQPPVRINVRPHREDEPFCHELWFCCDGRDAEGVRAAPSTLLWVDRVAGAVTEIEPPCDPVRSWSYAGLGMLECSDGELQLFDGERWAVEPGVPSLDGQVELQWHQDGGMALELANTALVRAPAEVGEGHWRAVELPTSDGWLVGPAGTVRFVEIADGVVHVRDEQGNLLGEQGGFEPGSYFVMPITGGVGLFSAGGGGLLGRMPQVIGLLVED